MLFKLILENANGDRVDMTATLQISYTNLMQWVYTDPREAGRHGEYPAGEIVRKQYRMVFDHNGHSVIFCALW